MPWCPGERAIRLDRRDVQPALDAGLVDRRLQSKVRQARRHVEQRPRDGGNAQPAPRRDVTLVERRLVHADCAAVAASRRHGDVDSRRNAPAQQREVVCARQMRHRGGRPERQSRGEQHSVCRQCTDPVDAPVHADEPTRPNGSVHAVVVATECTQLRAGDRAALARGEVDDPPPERGFATFYAVCADNVGHPPSVPRRARGNSPRLLRISTTTPSPPAAGSPARGRSGDRGRRRRRRRSR